MFICLYWGGPDAKRDLMTDRSVYRAGLNVGRGPIKGGADYVILCMCGMRYLGELTKTCANGFQFMFQVLRFSNGRARDDCREHTT